MGLSILEESTQKLGFKKRGTWWCGDNLNGDSGLFDAEFENHLKDIRAYCIKTGLDPWGFLYSNWPNGHKPLRHLYLWRNLKELRLE